MYLLLNGEKFPLPGCFRDGYVVVYDPAVQQTALTLVKGSYQRRLVLGGCRMSGADLEGRARKFSAGYARSRKNLLQRLQAAGLPVAEGLLKPTGRRVLVFGEPPGMGRPYQEKAAFCAMQGIR